MNQPRVHWHVTLPPGSVPDGPLTLTVPGIESVELKVAGDKVVTDADGARLLAATYPGAVLEAPLSADDDELSSVLPPTGAGGDTAGDDAAGPTA